MSGNPDYYGLIRPTSGLVLILQQITKLRREFYNSVTSTLMPWARLGFNLI